MHTTLKKNKKKLLQLKQNKIKINKLLLFIIVFEYNKQMKQNVLNLKLRFWFVYSNLLLFFSSLLVFCIERKRKEN